MTVNQNYNRDDGTADKPVGQDIDKGNHDIPEYIQESAERISERTAELHPEVIGLFFGLRLGLPNFHREGGLRHRILHHGELRPK